MKKVGKFIQATITWVLRNKVIQLTNYFLYILGVTIKISCCQRSLSSERADNPNLILTQLLKSQKAIFLVIQRHFSFHCAASKAKIQADGSGNYATNLWIVSYSSPMDNKEKIINV